MTSHNYSSTVSFVLIRMKCYQNRAVNRKRPCLLRQWWEYYFFANDKIKHLLNVTKSLKINYTILNICVNVALKVNCFHKSFPFIVNLEIKIPARLAQILINIEGLTYSNIGQCKKSKHDEKYIPWLEFNILIRCQSRFQHILKLLRL